MLVVSDGLVDDFVVKLHVRDVCFTVNGSTTLPSDFTGDISSCMLSCKLIVDIIDLILH